MTISLIGASPKHGSCSRRLAATMSHRGLRPSAFLRRLGQDSLLADSDVRQSLGRLAGGHVSDEYWSFLSLGFAASRPLTSPACPSPRGSAHVFGLTSMSTTSLPSALGQGSSLFSVRVLSVVSATRWQIVLHGDVFANQQQLCQKKRGIGKKQLLTIRALMLQEHVDLVAGNFNSTAWRRHCGCGRKSIIEEASADTDLPVPPPRPTVVGPRGSTR